MTPEQTARQEIDRQLDARGWKVRDDKSMNIAAGLGLAVRGFPLPSGPDDYLLYVDRKAAGVIEAKPVGHTLIGVEPQAARYTEGLAGKVPHYRLPLPFAYESTGVAAGQEPGGRRRPAGSGRAGTVDRGRPAGGAGAVCNDRGGVKGLSESQRRT